MARSHKHDKDYYSRNFACKICDIVLESPVLEPGEQASCPRCDTLISVGRDNSFQKGMAFSITALLLLLSTFYFPLLSFSRSGQERSMTLLDSGTALIASSEIALGWLVILLIIILPAVLLLIFFFLLLSLVLRIRHRANYWLARTYYTLREWNMVEVYIVGLLVSIAKIASLATIGLGVSFWGLLAFSIFFLIAHYSVDKHEVWETVKSLTPQ